jgi:hypothetical protein
VPGAKITLSLCQLTHWISFKFKAMKHSIYKVKSFRIEAPFTLRVRFDDGSEQVIDFRPMLAGVLYGPLRDASVFNKVRIDPEVETLVWPNGADFDPATLHDWPTHAPAMIARAQQWELTAKQE